MLNKIKTIVFRLIVSVAAVLSFSCDQVASVVNSKPTLTASENPVTVAVNWSKSVTITGGSGAYLIKSISDSSIILASVYVFQSTPKMISIEGRKLGTAKVVVQDSGKTAEVEITVTVAVMVASPSSVTVKVNNSKYVYFQGGTSPYSIDQQANSAIATVNFSGSSMYVKGNAPGSTSVTVKDNATPANKVIIPITVIPKPVFTTPGKISFNSSKGDFSVNGIAAEDILGSPANSEGAGAQLITSMSSSSLSANIGIIIGYKKKSLNIIDIVSIVFAKTSLSPGTLPIDSSNVLNGYDTAFVRFVFNGDLNAPAPEELYQLNSGTLVFTALSAQNTTGTFSGDGTLIRNEIPVPENTVRLTNGAFDVPVIVEDISDLASTSSEQGRIIAYTKRMLKKDLIMMGLLKE